MVAVDVFSDLLKCRFVCLNIGAVQKMKPGCDNNRQEGFPFTNELDGCEETFFQKSFQNIENSCVVVFVPDNSKIMGFWLR